MEHNHEATESVAARTREEVKKLKRMLELEYGIELHLDDGSLAYLHQVLQASGKIDSLSKDLRLSIDKMDGLNSSLTKRIAEIESVKIPSEVKLIRENKIEVGDFWKRVHMIGAAFALIVFVGSIGWVLYTNSKTEQQMNWFKSYVRAASSSQPGFHSEYMNKHPYPKP